MKHYPPEIMDKISDCELELQGFDEIIKYKWGYVVLLDNGKIVVLTNDVLGEEYETR